MPPACRAPTKALYLLPDGDLRSCCLSTYSLGSTQRDRLLDIWTGARRGKLVDRIARHDYGLGCSNCGNEVEVEGSAAAYPRQFDRFADPTGEEVDWPATMGFYFRNTCNLQCLQCNGHNSSSIRRHRDRLPPLRPRYDEQFFEDLRHFIPHLRLALFVGGEPLLIPEVFRTWELINELNPTLECEAVTNGTHWNDRIEAALESIRCSLTVSIDGATADTFESIRVGGRFEHVMANLDRFADYTRRAGTRLGINFCLMPENHHEFGDLLMMADDRGIQVNVSVVRSPAAHSIAHLPPDALRDVQRRLLKQSPLMIARLTLNRTTWEREVDRITSWAEATSEQRHSLGGHIEHTIIGFRREGEGPTDDRAARAELAAATAGALIHDLTIGPGDVITACNAAAEQLLYSVGDETLIGAPATAVWSALADKFGRPKSMEEIVRDDDRAAFVATFPTVEADIRLAALREADGHATAVSVLFTIRKRSSVADATDLDRQDRHDR